MARINGKQIALWLPQDSADRLTRLAKDRDATYAAVIESALVALEAATVDTEDLPDALERAALELRRFQAGERRLKLARQQPRPQP